MNKQLVPLLLLACAAQNSVINARVDISNHVTTNDNMILPLGEKNNRPNITDSLILANKKESNNNPLSYVPLPKSETGKTALSVSFEPAPKTAQQNKKTPVASISNKALFPIVYKLIEHAQKEYGDDIIKHGDEIVDNIIENKHVQKHIIPVIKKLHLDAVADDAADLIKKMSHDKKVQFIAKAAAAYGFTIIASKYLPDDLLQAIISGGSKLT